MKNETDILTNIKCVFNLSFLVSEVNQKTEKESEKMATYADLFESEKINAYPDLFETNMNNNTDTEKLPMEIFQ